MNRTIIATATILAVAAVAIFGLRTYSQATANPNVTVHDTDVNWDGRINVADVGLVGQKFNQQVPPGGRPVREQNLDANGNIKVAQQGPVDVNVLTSEPSVWEFTTLVINLGFDNSPPSIQGAINAAQPQLDALGVAGWRVVGPSTPPQCGSGCYITYTLERPAPTSAPTATPTP